MVNQGVLNEAEQGSVEPILQLWMLRIVLRLGGHKELIKPHGFNNDDLAFALGMQQWLDPDAQSYEPVQIQKDLRRRLQALDSESASLPVPSCLRANVAKIAELVGLNQTDCRLLEFGVLLHHERLLDDCADLLGSLPSIKVCHALAVILGLSESDVRAALHVQGVLGSSGLLSLDRAHAGPLRSKLDLLSNVFADLMMVADADPIELLRGMVCAAPPAELGLDRYEHLKDSLHLLRHYLRHAIDTRRRGVNILIHGVSGTGKTQLVRALARELDCKLFEVASEDADGDPIRGEQRLRAYSAAQSFFAMQRSMISFDEVEDVFNDGDTLFGRRSTAQLRKAWINRCLEENPVPALWISNVIEGMDPAFIRRFDMVVEVPVPPRSHRVAMLKASCSELLTSRQMTRLAEAENIAPAVLAKSVRVVQAVRSELDAGSAAHALEHLISRTLQAQGYRPLPANHDDALTLYAPHLVNADTDLAALAKGIESAGSARVCLFGAPGTGKTAYGRWLAEQLNRPLLIKKASDLISMWVGSTEKNIAHAFQQAEGEGAVLMVDEVDTFLQDRQGAQRSWEVSLVNEMLTQMESFSGVFIASTNLMDGLDPAALRRFDLKVSFHALRPDQARELFRCYCHHLQIEPSCDALAAVARLGSLTPGDFAVVLRQHRFRPITTAAALFKVLEAECSLKRARGSMGFV